MMWAPSRSRGKRSDAKVVLPLVVILSVAVPAYSQSPAPDDWDYTVVRVCEGIIQLFERSADEIWPGYNLARRPWVVYIPDKWALLLNCDHAVPGFAAYPSGWPDLGRPVRFHAGPYEGLVGQLVPSFAAGDVNTIAIGLPHEPSKVPPLLSRSLEEWIFGYIVHEAFHRYQRERFGEIPWAREERYPILDRENTALACLEMRLLEDALRKGEANDRSTCAELVGQFLAVRTERWRRGAAFVAAYEQGLELLEGTAKYVEVRSIALASDVGFQSAVPAKRSLAEALDKISAGQLVLMDFRDRFTAGSVSPEDMPRNRVYPVGAAQALLLDFFGIEWKAPAQKAGTDFTFAALFRDHLDVDPEAGEKLTGAAKRQYAYEAIIASTDKLIKEYADGYREALTAFEAQPGERVEIELQSAGVTRSRVSGARKWLAEAGACSLCAKYGVYTLRSKDLFLHIKESGVFEENDWDAYTRTVAFFAPQGVRVTLDGQPTDLEDGKVYRFDSLELTAGNATLRHSKPGTIRTSGRRTTIRLLTD